MEEPADVSRFHMAEAGCGRRQVCSVDTGPSCRGITCGWLLCSGRPLREMPVSFLSCRERLLFCRERSAHFRRVLLPDLGSVSIFRG